MAPVLILGLSLSTTLMAGHVFTIPHGIGIYVSPTGRDYKIPLMILPVAMAST